MQSTTPPLQKVSFLSLNHVRVSHLVLKYQRDRTTVASFVRKLTIVPSTLKTSPLAKQTVELRPATATATAGFSVYQFTWLLRSGLEEHSHSPPPLIPEHAHGQGQGKVRATQGFVAQRVREEATERSVCVCVCWEKTLFMCGTPHFTKQTRCLRLCSVASCKTSE